MIQLEKWFNSIYKKTREFVNKDLQWLALMIAIIRRMFKTFAEARGAEACASMAYFAFFSLFPLLIFAVAIGSYILQRPEVYQVVIEFFAQVLPTSETFIANTISQVIAARGAVSLIGLVVLLWSGSSYFFILTRNIDRALPHTRTRNYIQQRVTAFKMIAVVIVLLFMFLMANTLAGIIPKLMSQLPISDAIKQGFLWKMVPKLMSWLVAYFLFMILYRWSPAARISWGSVSVGACTAALLWQFVGGAFAWFLRSGVINYQHVYGSLGSISALLFWFYLSGYIILLGAHLSAAVEFFHKIRVPDEKKIESKAIRE